MLSNPLTNLLPCGFSCLALLLAPITAADIISLAGATTAASSLAPGFSADGPIDGNRFSTDPPHTWQGAARESVWWWQVRLDRPREVGAILQITGDHPFILRNSPVRYVWQGSDDGERWRDLAGTAVDGERRTFRLHRLAQPQRASWLRLQITAASGSGPALREVEFYSSPKDTVAFPDWIIAVNTTDDPKLPGPGREFIPLAQGCPNWGELQAQQVWLGQFDARFVAAEPRPLCGFLSGNFKDWCQISRDPWRGVEQLLRNKDLPLWASCGGAQGLALLAEVGADKPWDCPHCRDPLAPKSPIYTHLGHTGVRPCGDYSACIFERGPQLARRVADDPVFLGLPEVFSVVESHCGQIEWPPPGWELIATAGPGGKTRTQCLRLSGRYIYAAQFHIEMEGAPETSRQIMGNFLHLAKEWGRGRAGAEP